MTQGIIILDFGSQYNQLIARRIREFGVYTEIIPYNTSIEEIKTHNPKGIILSGGPSSVFGDEAALVEKELFEMGVPVLGICYGMQLISHLLGGEVKKGEKGEYGKSELTVLAQNSLLAGVPEQSTVWMSHFDEVMTARPITVLPDTSAADALWLMDDHHFRNLPVIDRQGQILGDMTYASIIQYLAARYPVEVLNRPARPEQYPRKPEGGD